MTRAGHATIPAVRERAGHTTSRVAHRTAPEGRPVAPAPGNGDAR
jgi:hypothetical protein